MKKIKLHIYGVLIYSAYVLILDYSFYSSRTKIPTELIVLALEFWIFYTGYAILYFLFLVPPSKRLISLPVSVISFLGTYFISYLSVLIHKRYDATLVFTIRHTIYDGLQFYTQFFIYSVGYFFVERSIQKQKQLRLSEQQQAETEKAKLEIENKNLRLQEDFLRAQINPHFLYNCLNFFYAQTFQNNPNVAEGVLMLSDIMRYSLKDYSSTNGLANLSEEIAHVENVINIHQLRFSASLQIAFTIEGNPQGKLVAPMVLITLVENVFKHGDLHDKENPVSINCTIDAARQNVYFSTYNKKKTGNHEGSTGIGLSNIKQRLQSLYKDNFGITTIDTNTSYKKEITIPYFNQQQQQNFSAGIANHAIG